jgi:hypothetical protein
MAKKVNYGEVSPSVKFTFIAKGRKYVAFGYPGQYFPNVPEGKYDYYARYDQKNPDLIESIKKEKTGTVNFFGSVVLDTPIDFISDEQVILREVTAEKL